nr:hypothetical protein CFP56_31021 [Quercus suber]
MDDTLPERRKILTAPRSREPPATVTSFSRECSPASPGYAYLTYHDHAVETVELTYDGILCSRNENTVVTVAEHAKGNVAKTRGKSLTKDVLDLGSKFDVTTRCLYTCESSPGWSYRRESRLRNPWSVRWFTVLWLSNRTLQIGHSHGANSTIMFPMRFLPFGCLSRVNEHAGAPARSPDSEQKYVLESGSGDSGTVRARAVSDQCGVLTLECQRKYIHLRVPYRSMKQVQEYGLFDSQP